MKTYQANWDNTVKVATSIVLMSIVTGISWISVAFAQDKIEDVPAYLPWIGFAVALLSIGVAYLIRPQSYKVGLSKIIIERALGDIELRKSDIQRIQEIDKSVLGRSIRSFGVGGLFGYMGKFYSKKMGNYTAYVTDKNHLVLIKMKSGKKYLISPDQTDWVEEWL